MSDSFQTQPEPASSQAQMRALKQKLRSLRWEPLAVMREVELIQKLRALVRGTSGRH